MKKSTVSLIVAGLLTVGGIASAETFDSPSRAGEASTMTMGQPNQLTTNSPYADNTTVWVDTTVLGAAPATVMVPIDHYVYVQPGWSGSEHQRHQAAATFNVPARAGEASTMTGGVPNVSTDNQRIANNTYVPVYSVPN